jgi:hypothetical protein
MCSSLKQLILDRQNAFHNGNMSLWKHYRNKVKQAIISQKQSFYSEKVRHLKQTDSRLWWKLVKRLSGNANTSPSFHIEKNGSILNDQELVNELNEFFTSVNADIPPLNLHNLPAFLPSIDQIPTIQPYHDQVRDKLLKTFAYILAEPITDIFNVSLSSGVVPEIWKQANIFSIPKESPPKILCDFRPISLISTISKVLEEFVVDWITEDICDKIDAKQFGSLKGGSTTKCLLDMLHNWISNVDKQGNSLRVCLLDFSTAFDRININIPIEKLLNLGVRRCLIPWICNFLSDRKQRVKLGETVSDWMSVNAGVPQVLN